MVPHTLLQLPHVNPRMIKLCRWVNPHKDVLMLNKECEIFQAEQEDLRALYFWVPAAEMCLPFLCQPDTSRECQNYSTCTMQTVCSKFDPRDVLALSTHHSDCILHVQKWVVSSVLLQDSRCSVHVHKVCPVLPKLSE